MKGGWWKSQKAFYASLVLFLVSVFCAYTTVELDQFYRTDVVVLEFLAALLSGGSIGFIVYKNIFSEK